MSVIFSRQCEYALQAVMYLALKPEEEMTSIRELTMKLHTPYFFMAKILQDLVYKGLLKSHKGPSGGFTLALPAKKITLHHIIEAVDGNDLTQGCILGFPECSSTAQCALHDQWSNFRDNIFKALLNKTIEEMSINMRKPQYHLQ